MTNPTAARVTITYKLSESRDESDIFRADCNVCGKAFRARAETRGRALNAVRKKVKRCFPTVAKWYLDDAISEDTTGLRFADKWSHNERPLRRG